MDIKDTEVRCLLSDMHIEERAGAENSRTITGYAVKFETWSEPLYGWFKETIARGAFDGCDMSDVIMCFNHNVDDILARTSSGTLSIEVDDVGVKFSFVAPNTTTGNDMLELVRRGDVNKCSFRFSVESDSWVYSNEINNLEYDERTIIKVKLLRDCALVTFPAYKDTEASVRSLQERKETYLELQKPTNNRSSSRDRLCHLYKLQNNR